MYVCTFGYTNGLLPKMGLAAAALYLSFPPITRQSQLYLGSILFSLLLYAICRDGPLPDEPPRLKGLPAKSITPHRSAHPGQTITNLCRVTITDPDVHVLLPNLLVQPCLPNNLPPRALFHRSYRRLLLLRLLFCLSTALCIHCSLSPHFPITGRQILSTLVKSERKSLTT